MNDHVRISIRINPVLKKRCDEVFHRLGMNTNAGIRLFLCQMILYQGIPFDLTLENAAQQISSCEKTISFVLNLDRELKEQCVRLAAGAGLNLSQAIKLYLVQVVDKNRIPFPVKMNERV